MKTASSDANVIEMVFDLETAASVNSNSRTESYLFGLKTNEPKEDPKPILVSGHLVPEECIEIDDDSDDDITFLGSYESTALPKNTQISDIKDETPKDTTTLQNLPNHCVYGSEVKNTSESQDIIPAKKDFLKEIDLNDLNASSSSLTIDEKVRFESESPHNNHGIAKSSSDIQNGTSRANETSDANYCIIEKELKRSCLSGEPIRKTLTDNHKKPTNSSHKDSVSCSTQKLNINYNTGLTLKDNSQIDLNNSSSSSAIEEEGWLDFGSVHNIRGHIKSSSNIQNGIDRANKSSNASFGTTPSEKETKSSCLSEKPISKTLSENLKNPANSSHKDSLSFPTTNINTNYNKGPILNSSFTTLPSKPSPQETIQKSNQVVSNTCLLQDRSSSLSDKVGNLIDPIEKNESSISAQKTFGNQIKQQVRFVEFPAIFPTEKVSEVITGKDSSGNTILKILHTDDAQKSINMNSLKAELPCTSGVKILPKLLPKVPDVNGPNKIQVRNPVTKYKKVIMVSSNLNNNTNRNNTIGNKNIGPSEPPKLILVNNQVIKLKGIKKPESGDTSIHSSNSSKTNVPTSACIKSTNRDQCCQTENSMSNVVDRSCQTYIYSWIYKNGKLYTIVDDGGKQVELVPVDTVRVTKPSTETNIASPVSSLDDESDFCLDDEMSMMDEHGVSNKFVNELSEESRVLNKFVEVHDHSHNNTPLQSCHKQFNSNTSEIRQTQTNDPPRSYQPENTFQEVLYSDLGLYNPTSRSSGGTQTDAFACQYDNTIANTVSNCQLLTSLPNSQIAEAQLPVVKGQVQDSTPTTNSVIEYFHKLLEDIKTCLHSDALGNIPLHQAVLGNDLDKLRSQIVVLKNIGSDLNHINLAHETALMLAVKVAVETSNYDAVSILVAEGAEQHITDQEGNTPLHYAVKHGCEPLVRVLLTADDAEKVTTKFNYDGFTPLHIAAMEGHDSIIILLVGTGIHIDVKDRKNGRTPYFLAVKEKKKTSAELLKMLSADVNEPNFSNEIPLPHTIHISEQSASAEDKNHTEVKIPHVYRMKTFESNLPPLRTSNQSLVSVGADELGINPPSQVVSGNECARKKGQRAFEVCGVKELYGKYITIAGKRKSDILLGKPTVKPKSAIAKNTKPEQNKNKNIEFQCNNVEDSSTNLFCQKFGSFMNKNTSQLHCPATTQETISMESNCKTGKVFHGNNEINEAHKISINNDSVLYNKAVLTSSNFNVREKILCSNDVIENKGNTLKPNELKTHRVQELSKSTGETVQYDRNSTMFTDVNLPTLNPHVQGSSLKNLTVDYTRIENSIMSVQESCQSSRDVNAKKSIEENVQSFSNMKTKKKEFHFLDSSLDNPNSMKKEYLEERLLNNNPISHSSLTQLTTNDRESSSHQMPPNLHLEEKSNELLRKPHLSRESHDKNHSACPVLNHDYENSVETKQPLNDLSYSSSSIYSANNVELSPPSSVSTSYGVNISGDGVNSNNTVEVAPPSSVSTSDGVNISSKGANSNNTVEVAPPSSVSTSDGVNISGDGVNSNNTVEIAPPSSVSTSDGVNISGDGVNSNNTVDVAPPSSVSTSDGVNISGDGVNSNKTVEVAPPSSVSTSDGVNISGDGVNSNNTVEVKHDTSPSDNTTSSTLHTSKSTKLSDEVLTKSLLEYKNDQLLSFEDSNPAEQFDDNETNSGSSDEDSCFVETSFSLNPTNIKHVIVGKNSFLSETNDRNKTTSLNLTPEDNTGDFNLSFGTVFEDVVINKKIKNTSKKFNPKLQTHRKRKYVESKALLDDFVKKKKRKDSLKNSPPNQNAELQTHQRRKYVESKALLDDIVKKTKMKNSPQKGNSEVQVRQGRKCDESKMLLMNTQDSKHKKRANTKTLRTNDSVDILPKLGDKPASYTQKVVPNSEVNVSTKELQVVLEDLRSSEVQEAKRGQQKLHLNKEKIQINNDNSSKTYSLNATKPSTVLNSESPKVPVITKIRNLRNPEKKQSQIKPFSADLKVNTTAVVSNSSDLVANIRNKLVSLVSRKGNKEITAVSGSTESQSKAILEKPHANSNVSEQTNKSKTSSLQKSCNTQSQNSTNASKKRSLDSVEHVRQETVETNVRNKVESFVSKKGYREPETMSGATEQPHAESNVVGQTYKSKTSTVLKSSDNPLKGSRIDTRKKNVESAKDNSQEKDDKSLRKRSLNSVKPEFQVTEEKRICNSNNKVVVRKGKDVQSGFLDVSRKSTRISRKRVEFNL